MTLIKRLSKLFRRRPPPPSGGAGPAADAGTRRDNALAADIHRLTGFEPNDLSYYDTALRHRSILRRRSDTRLISNERLEFLGDAVLGFVVGEHLYHRFRNEDEGFLTRLRAKLVNGGALARAARELGLGEIIRMSDDMVRKDGRDNASILADALEAVIGAIYLDLGLNPARDFVHRVMLDDVNLSRLAERKDNYKSLLLEHVQADSNDQPRYEVVTEEGPGHERMFTVEVLVGDRVLGSGTAGSKKAAEQHAAREALDRLVDEDERTNRAFDRGDIGQ